MQGNSLAVRLNADGDSLWMRAYDRAWSRFYRVTLLPDGFAFTGVIFGLENMIVQPWLVRTDPNGELLWDRWWNFETEVAPPGIALLPDGGFALAFTEATATIPRARWLHTNALGEMDWSAVLRDSASVYAAVLLPNGGLAIAGSVRRNATDSDMLLMRTASLSGSASEFSPSPAQMSLVCYPNPFNSRTTLSFALARGEMIHVALYDVLGRCVCVLADSFFAPGEHLISIDGRALSSGIYWVRIQSESEIVYSKLLLIR